VFEESYLEIKTLSYSSSSVRLSDACSLISISGLDDRDNTIYVGIIQLLYKSTNLPIKYQSDLIICYVNLS